MEMEDDRRERISLAEAQYEASSTIYGSNDPVEILNALISFGGQAFAEAHLGLLDPETQIVNVIAARDKNGVRALQAVRRLDEYPAYETLSAVEVLYIEDVDADPFLTETERASIKGRGIGAMLVIPLVVAQRLTGLISFTDAKSVTVSPLSLRAMRNLGDQIAVVFENQALLRSTATTLDEVQQLYDTNRSMLSALNPGDIVRALRDHVAQGAGSITHAVIERSGTEETILLRHVATPHAEQTVEIPLTGLKTKEVFGDSETNHVLFIEDVENQGENRLLHDALQLDHVRSYIVLVMRDSGAVQEFIAIAYDHPQLFDSRTRRLYNAVTDQIGIVLQNQRLLRNAQSSAGQFEQQVRVLQGLNRLATGLSNFPGEKQLLDYAAESLVKALSVDHVGIALFERGGSSGTVISEYPDHQAVGSKVEARNSAMMDRLRGAPDQAVVIADIGTDPLIELDTRAILRKIGVVSIMIIALQATGEIVGTVGFDLYNRSIHFTPEMIETAQTMVSQIAIGLQNIRLLSDAQRRAEQLQSVTALGQSVQSTLRMDSMLQIMLNESSHMIPMDRMSIAYYDAEQGQLRVAGQYEEGTTTVDLVNGPLLAMNGTFVGQVWETQEMLTIADTHIITAIGRVQDPHLASWAYDQIEMRALNGITRMQDLSMRSVMVAPIRSRGRQIGTVSVGCFRPYSYQEADRAIFQQMINQLAVAIENAEVYRQSQRVAQNEALINEISTHFQQHGEVEDMLQIAITELGEALGARRGRIRLSIQSSENSG